MISYKVYRVCLVVVLASLVSVLLSWRYRSAYNIATEGTPLPKHLIESSQWYSSSSIFLASSKCTLKDFSDELENFSNVYSYDEEDCIHSFFESCITDELNLLIHTGEVYELNVKKLEIKHSKHLKALGYMFAMAYKNSIYLDMDFDSKLIAAVFSTFSNVGDSIRAYGLNYSSNLWIFNALMEGRKQFFLDFEIGRHRYQIVDHVKTFISKTEPLRFRNWWKYGFVTYLNDDKALQDKVYQCLRKLPREKLYKLYSQSTGYAEMPLGGANRLNRIKFNLSGGYKIEKNQLFIEQDFDCEEFTACLD